MLISQRTITQHDTAYSSLPQGDNRGQRDSLILGRVESEVIMDLVRLMLGYAAITS